MLRFIAPSDAPIEVTLHSPWRRRSLSCLLPNASASQLSSSSASPVHPYPIDEFRQHAAVMRANRENTAYSPDPGRCRIMRSIPGRVAGRRHDHAVSRIGTELTMTVSIDHWSEAISEINGNCRMYHRASRVRNSRDPATCGCSGLSCRSWLASSAL